MKSRSELYKEKQGQINNSVNNNYRTARKSTSYRNGNSYYKKNNRGYRKNNEDIQDSTFVLRFLVCGVITFLIVASDRYGAKTDNVKTYVKEIISKNYDLSYVTEELRSMYNDVKNDTDTVFGIDSNEAVNIQGDSTEEFTVDTLIFEDVSTVDIVKGKQNVNNTESVKEEITSEVVTEEFAFINPMENIITSSFGIRTNPVNNESELHTGLDIRGDLGDPIVAVANGVVTDVYNSPLLGNAVVYEITDKGYTDLKVLYGHCDSVVVEVGDKINQGDVIARCGTTGRSTGTHLHYTIYQNGELVDPMQYVDLKYTQEVIDEYASRGEKIK